MWEVRVLSPFKADPLNLSGLVTLRSIEEEDILLAVTRGDISLFCFLLYT
jgi:hypothetical protein